MSKSNRQKANMAKPNAPAAKSTSHPANRKVAPKRNSGKLVWLVAGLVIAVVVGLVIVKVSTGKGGTTAAQGFQPTSAQMASEITQVPSSVLNTVGVTSGAASITPPTALKGQPALTATSSTGAKLPEVFYLGSEYCPYCAAQRWSTIIALRARGNRRGLVV